jgi:UDP-N-acetylmuramate dehydrogenase
VNKGKATAADILALIGFIQDKARKEKGIDLETEVIVVGEN